MSESEFKAVLERFIRLREASTEYWCVNCTASFRVMVRKIVTEGTRCGQALEIADHEIEAEAAAIRAAYPAGAFIECQGYEVTA